MLTKATKPLEIQKKVSANAIDFPSFEVCYSQSEIEI